MSTTMKQILTRANITPQSLPAIPGRLTSKDDITLHTVSAQQLYTGTKRGPVGLEKFCALMLNIWRAAAQDDVYADEYLLHFYNQYVKADRLLKKLEAKYRKKLILANGVSINLKGSENPITISCDLKTPFGHMAAYLIGAYDRLCRVIVTAKHAALIPQDDPDELFRTMRKKIRQVLSIPLQWQYTGVTRDDLVANNQKVQRAQAIIQRMRKPSKDVMERMKRAPYAPRIKKEGVL